MEQVRGQSRAADRMLALYIVTLFAASEQGTLLLSYVKESSILSYLYENNILMQIITAFL